LAIELPALPGIDLTVAIQVIAVVVITYVVAAVLRKTLVKVFEKTPFPENLENSVIRFSRWIVYFIGFLVLLSILGIDLSGLIVGIGALSIAISFATKDIIQNLVSGVMVFGERFFKKGDLIRVRAFEGRVVKISIRSTLIQKEDGTLVSIPNSLIINAPVEKLTKNPPAKKVT
jgi:small-conductance mechanosensitive channel